MYFFFNATAPTVIYTLSLHDALPIYAASMRAVNYASTLDVDDVRAVHFAFGPEDAAGIRAEWARDRKSTRLNSSHVEISYAVFCLKKKTVKRLPVPSAIQCDLAADVS